MLEHVKGLRAVRKRVMSSPSASALVEVYDQLLDALGALRTGGRVNSDGDATAPATPATPTSGAAAAAAAITSPHRSPRTDKVPTRVARTESTDAPGLLVRLSSRTSRTASLAEERAPSEKELSSELRSSASRVKSSAARGSGSDDKEVSSPFASVRSKSPPRTKPLPQIDTMRMRSRAAPLSRQSPPSELSDVDLRLDEPADVVVDAPVEATSPKEPSAVREWFAEAPAESSKSKPSTPTTSR